MTQDLKFDHDFKEIRTKSIRFGKWGEMHFPSSISSKLFGVTNSRYTRTQLACWNVHYRTWKLIIYILVSHFRSSDPTLCEQSVEHDHLHEYYPAEGITADSVETLLLGFGVLFLEHRYWHNNLNTMPKEVKCASHNNYTHAHTPSHAHFTQLSHSHGTLTRSRHPHGAFN